MPRDVASSAESQWRQGWTPLHRAAHKGHVEVSQMLVAAGSNLHATTVGGQRPIDLAESHMYSAVVKLLQQESEPLTKSAAQGGAGHGGADRPG
mmetsp:Transcript_34530/g.74620  ORF Transcript_34530/g.74620 Transcript_34530/m.74620 type:complete len:94 (+) Transcript_34530:384-665(+)|eukprot:CAMPEP_0175837012 /NCGR_PEP_ID=MMETSP0107_2-20121207/17457_1 /TAXON_ID=195067 ORGANISM="Goniomonas pacifica, Strain CCMP1869" /NCGR_SAMPLE_ID=MMETSP0107_2 /ASSEMBLY_ACC=CAM_ASM_000203 /LENGTH=93 /DNA_ID=CAMNT_0017150461 /DNA_START=420 /DNA_END=701 /DNA_ORIENTATION=+